MKDLMKIKCRSKLHENDIKELFIDDDSFYITFPKEFSSFKDILLRNSMVNPYNNIVIEKMYKHYCDIVNSFSYLDLIKEQKSRWTVSMIFGTRSHTYELGYWEDLGYSEDESKVILGHMRSINIKTFIYENGANWLFVYNKMISDKKEENYNKKEIEKLLNNRNSYDERLCGIISKEDWLRKRIERFKYTVAPKDGCVKELIVCKDGDKWVYTNIPKDYEFVKMWLIKYAGFNPNNEEFIKSFYYDVYCENVRNYLYWNNRNRVGFGKVFGVFSNTQLNVRYWIERGYSEDEYKEFLKKRQNSASLGHYIEKYGDEEGRKRYNERDLSHYKIIGDKLRELRKSGKGYLYSKTINPETGKFYTLDEALPLMKENSKKGAAASIEVQKMRNFSVFQKGYWMGKGLPEEDAVLEVSKRMLKNGLDSYIKKYGEDEGTRRFNIRVEKYKKTCTSKSKEDILAWNAKKINRTKHGISKASIKFFDLCTKKLSEEGIIIDKVYYGSNEYYIYDKEKCTIYFYDFCDLDDMVIVEYNGIKYHPKYWEMSDKELDEWRSLFYGISGREQMEKDKRKKEIAESHGFTFITIWEDADSVELINNVVNTIKNKRHNG